MEKVVCEVCNSDVSLSLAKMDDGIWLCPDCYFELIKASSYYDEFGECLSCGIQSMINRQGLCKNCSQD